MQLKSKIQRDYAILFKSSKKNLSVTTVSLLLRYLMVYLSLPIFISSKIKKTSVFYQNSPDLAFEVLDSFV